MATAADFTARARDDMYGIYTAYQQLRKRIDDLTDEVNANGGAEGLYGAGGSAFPDQGDGFGFVDMVEAFTAVTSMVGAPTAAQKRAVIKARR